MLLFGSIEQLELLCNNLIIMIDGTFNASPPFFDQIYTIHAIKYETSEKILTIKKSPQFILFKGFPCVFGLLSDRERLTYQQLFQELESTVTAINRIFKSEWIISDFEPSLIPAVAHEVNYFQYHSRQCMIVSFSSLKRFTVGVISTLPRRFTVEFERSV